MISASRFLQSLSLLVRAVRYPGIRAELFTRLRYRDRHMQGPTHTGPNRFPTLFTACQALLSNVPEPAILSFGCSIGDEPFTLAGYLPTAHITGVDINNWALRKARRRNLREHSPATAARIQFLHRTSPAYANLQNLDAIFCMAVFQRTENREGEHSSASATTIRTGFTFQVFEQELRELDSKLKPGGFLFLDQADFLFSHTAVAAHYTPLLFEGSERHRNRPVFGPDNHLLATEYTAPRCFRKHLPA